MELEASFQWEDIENSLILKYVFLSCSQQVKDAILLSCVVQSLPCLSGMLRTQVLSDLPWGSPVFKVGVLAHRECRQPPVEVTAVFRDILPR